MNAQKDPYVTQTPHVQTLSDLTNVHVLKSFMEMDSNVYQYTQIVSSTQWLLPHEKSLYSKKWILTCLYQSNLENCRYRTVYLVEFFSFFFSPTIFFRRLEKQRFFIIIHIFIARSSRQFPRLRYSYKGERLFHSVPFKFKLVPGIEDCELTCHQNASCTKLYGSFDCKCNRGFIGDGFDKCDGELGHTRFLNTFVSQGLKSRSTFS